MNGLFVCDNSNDDNDTADCRYTSRSVLECCCGVFLNCASIDSAFCEGVSINTVFLEDDFLHCILLLSPFFFLGFPFYINNDDGAISIDGSNSDDESVDASKEDGDENKSRVCCSGIRDLLLKSFDDDDDDDDDDLNNESGDNPIDNNNGYFDDGHTTADNLN